MADTKALVKVKDNVPNTVVCLMLSTTNYSLWTMRKKVLLRIHKVWEAIEPGSTDEEMNDIAIALLF